MAQVIVVEDERDIAEAIEYNLSQQGYAVSKAFDGINALRLAQVKLPNLIILDLMLPGIDGIELCKRLKANPKTSGIPVIMLTAKSSEVDKIVGLEVGADDYITKPFSMRELLARVKTVLKRYGKKQEKAKPLIKFPNLEIDLEKHEVKAFGRIIELTAKEFNLLKYLADNQEKAVSREKLLDQVWGIEVAIETRTVDVHVRRLREKLGKAGRYIKTLRGVGYKFKIQ